MLKIVRHDIANADKLKIPNANNFSMPYQNFRVRVKATLSNFRG
jgi:hypothetical protein